MVRLAEKPTTPTDVSLTAGDTDKLRGLSQMFRQIFMGGVLIAALTSLHARAEQIRNRGGIPV